MKRLTMILAVAGLIVTAGGGAKAAFVHVSDNGYTPGIVTYVSPNANGYPTPHKLGATEVPQTTFLTTDNLFAGSQFSLAALDLDLDPHSDDDVDNDDRFYFQMKFYRPDSSFAWMEDTYYLVTTLKGWRDLGYTSAEHWSNVSSEGDGGLWTRTTPVLGTWSVEEYIEGTLMDTHSFDVVIPEPAGLGLLGLGLFGLIRRRRS